LPHVVNSSLDNQNALKLKILSEAGVHPRNHKKLLNYPLEDLQRAIELAQKRADASFDGYIVTVLRQGFFDEREKWSSLPETQPSAPAHAQGSNAIAPSLSLEADSAAPALTQPQPQTQPVNGVPPLRVVARHEVQQPQADPQAHSAPQPVQNPDDPDGQKAALFHSVGLKPQHYTPFITYRLSDIQAAIQSACERQAKHVGHYALAILKKQPTPPHETTDYEALMNRWHEYETTEAAPPPDDNHDIWMSFGRTALATMGEKDMWRSIQQAYAGFNTETNELMLKREKLPHSDIFVQRFVGRLEMVTWNYQEANKEKRFCAKVKLV